MYKTANQVADEILEKVAISVEMASRAAANALSRKGIVAGARGVGDMTSNPAISLLAHQNPRTALRTKGLDFSERPSVIEPFKKHTMALLANQQARGGGKVSAKELFADPRVDRTGNEFTNALDHVMAARRARPV